MRALKAMFVVLVCLAAVGRGVPARAEAPDTTDFLFRLGMLQGHLMIGRELIDAGQTRLALPHFGHPVRELYDDIAPWMAANKVAPFEEKLVRLEAAVASAPRAPATIALYDEVLSTVQGARRATPVALRESIPEMIRICADTIDAAAGEYSEALKGGRIDSLVEYHDSRGFLLYVGAELDRLAGLAGDTAVVGQLRAVLAKAQRIVDPLIPGTQPKASVAGYRAIAADAARVAGK